jgi:hypothetical protein
VVVLRGPSRRSAIQPGSALSEQDRRILWEQFVGVYASSQQSFDTAVRAIAAAGLGLTVSLATALHTLPASGVAAASLFLVSLFCNLTSFGTAQLDMRKRVDCLRRNQTEGIQGNGWTTATKTLNLLAGLGVVAGGILLAIYIAHST